MSHRFRIPDWVPPRLLGALLASLLVAARAGGNPIAVTHDNTESLLSTLGRGFPSSLVLGARDDAKSSAPRVAPFEGADGRLIAPFSVRVGGDGVARLDVNDDLGMDQPMVSSSDPARRARSQVTDALLGSPSNQAQLGTLDYHAGLRRLPRRSATATSGGGAPTEQRWILGPVPEPASWIVWAVGGVGVLLLHRRARRGHGAKHDTPLARRT